MSVLEDNSKTYLRQLEDSELASELWGKLGSEQLFLWRKGQRDPYEVFLDAGKSRKSDFSQLFFKVDETLVKLFQIEYKEKEVMLKFKFNAETQVFTSAQMRWDEDAGLFVARILAPFFITTKRSTCRYVTDRRDRISVAFEDKLLPCYDISSGGFSTLLSSEEAKLFTKGMVIEKLELRYHSKKFTIPQAKLVKVSEEAHGKGQVRLAFQFEGLKPLDEDAIWMEVNKSIKRIMDLIPS